MNAARDENILEFSTRHGPCALSYGPRGLRRVWLPRAPVRGTPGPHPRKWRDLARRLGRVLAGERVAFDDVTLEMSGIPGFHERIYALLRRVPAGETLSYGELAARAGSPGAARAVGQAMARNRWPIVVPCHRVLRSGGRLGGFSAPGGIAFKRVLLEAERQTND